MDVAPNQIASIAASLIPFLEHDDANRALMGSSVYNVKQYLYYDRKLQLLEPAEPLVAKDSRVLINAEGNGVVEYVDANEIVIRYNRSENDRLVSFDDDTKSYKLTKFRKTNQNTCINLKPIVAKGEKGF